MRNDDETERSNGTDADNRARAAVPGWVSFGDEAWDWLCLKFANAFGCSEAEAARRIIAKASEIRLRTPQVGETPSQG